MRVRLVLTAVTVAVLVAPTAVRAADPVMKLSDVHAGMRCSALSVIQGTSPSSFDIAVLDVLRGDPEAGGPRILFRASGPAVDATGIGPGFSGSPIYCPDGAGVQRVAGAISEGIGQYGNHVALATPIEDMLGVRPSAPPQARKASRLLRSARPLANPLSVSGLSGQVRRAALAAARRAGIPLFATPSGPATPFAPYELSPGTSIAAGLSTGDIAVGAIGTVSYRDGDKLWAFGHPLDGFGRRSLPLLDAYVYAIVDNPLGFEEATTYKLATAGRPVGTMTTDGIGAIAGRVGPPPSMIPLTVTARNDGGGRKRTIHVNVADERSLDLGSALNTVGTLAAGQAMTEVLGAAPPQFATSMCLRVSVRQRRKPMRFCQQYSEGFSPLDDLSTAFSLIDGFKYGPLGIRDVAIRMRLRPRVSEAFILAARAPLRVRRGQRVRVRMLLQRSRAGRRVVSFPYRVPRSVKPGLRILTIRGEGGNGGLDGLEDLFVELLFGGSGGGGGAAAPRSVGELAGQIASLGSPDGVRASFSRKRHGPVVYTSQRLLIRGKTQIPMIVRKKR
jgi:hypothetical protein